MLSRRLIRSFIKNYYFDLRKFNYNFYDYILEDDWNKKMDDRKNKMKPRSVKVQRRNVNSLDLERIRIFLVYRPHPPLTSCRKILIARKARIGLIYP